MKHSLIQVFGILSLMVSCSTITAQRQKDQLAKHHGKIYQTQNGFIEIAETENGLKFYPMDKNHVAMPVKNLEVKDAFFSNDHEKTNHSLAFRKTKDALVGRGSFDDKNTYRIHFLLKHDGLDEDVTLKYKFSGKAHVL